MATFNEYNTYFLLAADGNLPTDFDQWEIVDESGWSVAHIAAMSGHLPSDFKRWDLADNTGWTVAHEAAENGHLPENFELWLLADRNGWTVAHEAARAGNLPKDFDRWEIADSKGWSVAHEAAIFKTRPGGDACESGAIGLEMPFRKDGMFPKISKTYVYHIATSGYTDRYVASKLTIRAKYRGAEFQWDSSEAALGGLAVILGGSPFDGQLYSAVRHLLLNIEGTAYIRYRDISPGHHQCGSVLTSHAKIKAALDLMRPCVLTNEYLQECRKIAETLSKEEWLAIESGLEDCNSSNFRLQASGMRPEQDVYVDPYAWRELYGERFGMQDLPLMAQEQPIGRTTGPRMG